MITFEYYVRHYNNRSSGKYKILEIENVNGLDVFKRVSLLGLTQKYVFKRSGEKEYFVGIGKENTYIFTQHRKLGKRSIIFYPQQEAGVTLIKEHELCRKVFGTLLASILLVNQVLQIHLLIQTLLITIAYLDLHGMLCYSTL